MVDRVACLVLPLVHHLVQQRVERLVPAMAADVPPTDRNLGRFAERRTGVVSQPAPHAARHAYRHGAELAVEVLGIVPLMPPRQLTDEVAVLGARAQPARRHWRRPDWMRDDRSP